jgi:PhnB protein
MKIPSQYPPIMPYVTVADANAFTVFMQKVFGASVQDINKSGNKIQHAELRIGDAVVMYMETSSVYPHFPTSSFIWVDNVDEVFERAVDAGCPVLNELADRDYARSAGFSDPEGNVWWVNSPLKES